MAFAPLSLDAARETVRTVGHEPSRPGCTEVRLQLLLLEDDDDLRSEISEYMTRRHHGVTALGSVAEARQVFDLLLASGGPLDAVICDLNLQDGDGIDMFVAFAPRRPACRWILMSGDPDPQRLAAVRRIHPALPPCMVVEKPVSLRHLAQLLASGRGSE